MRNALVAAFVLTVPFFIHGEVMDRLDIQEAEVTEVVDGDTLKVDIDNRTEIIRLIGMDTPETHTGNSPELFGLRETDEANDCLDKWGEKASRYVEREVLGEEVELVMEGDRRDRYGRIRAYVETGEDLNYDLVRKGYATVFPARFSEKERYEKAEKDAREEEKGLWGCSEYIES